MKIALIFWGLTRSLKFTIKTIEKRIFKILKDNNIDYDIYLHTYKINNLYSNKRANENNIKLDFEEYKLLNPDYFIYDDQDTIKEKLKLFQYRTHKDPWESDYSSLDNFILAMYSKLRITKLLEENVLKSNNDNLNKKENIYTNKINSNNILINSYQRQIKLFIKENNNKKVKELNLKIKKLESINKNLELDSEYITGDFIYKLNSDYKYCVFLRPDVFYINDFNLDFFNLVDDNNICIPNFCLFANFNDRFFISTYKNGLLYGKLFNEMLAYSKENELHSETFHYHIIKKYNLNINLINFLFDRVRADGRRICTDHQHNVEHNVKLIH